MEEQQPINNITVPKLEAKTAGREVGFPQEKEVGRVEQAAKGIPGPGWKSFLDLDYLRPLIIIVIVIVVVGALVYTGFRIIKLPNLSSVVTPVSPSSVGVNVTKSDDTDVAFRELFSLQLATTTYGTTTVVYPFVSKENTVIVRGLIGLAFSGNKVRYAIYDIRSGLFAPIINSDGKVGDALKPFLGTVVTVSGTHVAGSRDITITTLNDKPI